MPRKKETNQAFIEKLCKKLEKAEKTRKTNAYPVWLSVITPEPLKPTEKQLLAACNEVRASLARYKWAKHLKAIELALILS